MSSPDTQVRGPRNRRRGAEGEREIVALLRDEFGIELRSRRLAQEDDGRRWPAVMDWKTFSRLAREGIVS